MEPARFSDLKVGSLVVLDSSKEVYAEIARRNPDGSLGFWVTNGAWDGVLWEKENGDIAMRVTFTGYEVSPIEVFLLPKPASSREEVDDDDNIPF